MRPLRSAVRRLPRRVVLVVAALVAALSTVAYSQHQLTPPGPPTFSNITDTSVTVTAPADGDCIYNGTRPHNLLKLQRKLTGQADAAYTDIATNLYSSTATSVTGLSPGIGYTFRCIKSRLLRYHHSARHAGEHDDAAFVAECADHYQCDANEPDRDGSSAARRRALADAAKEAGQ